MAGEPNLSPGDTGEWVAYLQQMLTHNGFPVSADGEYGNATAQALDLFQEVNGLNTGSVDSTTWGRLTGETTAAAGAGAGAGSDQAGVIRFDPAEFQTFFGMYGVQGDEYVASLGLEAPQQDDDGTAVV